METHLTVPGITCDHCLDTVNQAIRRFPWARLASADLARRRIRISHDRPIPTADLLKALDDVGYPATLASEEPEPSPAPETTDTAQAAFEAESEPWREDEGSAA